MKVFLTTLLLILILLMSASVSFAQSVPDATIGAKFINVSYDLPYPGILPDNPLYFLKALRDNVYNFFITDPVKKAEYDLLMADKRLASASALVDKNNYQLAITTLSKSGNYFDQAIQLAASAQMQNKDAKDVLNKLYIASQKHQQVIYQLSQKTKGDIKYQLELAQVRVKGFQDTVDVIRAQ